MPEDYPLSVQNAMSQWWQYWGFKDNPFATSEAEQEHFLPFAFVDTGKLSRIYGNPDNPQTILFFASRGCGKTAHRRKLESDACPARIGREILTVSYTEFSFWRNLTRKPMPEDHLSAILSLSVKSVIRTAAKLNKEQIENLSDMFFERLSHICHEFSSGTLNQIHSNQDGILSIPWLKSVESPGAFSLFLNRLKKTKIPKYSLREPSYHTAAKVLVESIQELGPKAIYVLVDAVDEVILDGLSWIDCLEPLLSDLQLMRMPGLAFKFFLPAEQKSDLFERGYVRSDKLSYAELVWTADDLHLLLANRLRAFNEAGIDSLRMMCEPQLSTQIDHLLVEKSRYIPRNLLQVGQHLIAVHCSQRGNKNFLTITDWDQTLKEAESSAWFLKPSIGLPLLEIGPSFAAIGKSILSLSKQEYGFLWCLAQNNGTCDKEIIIQAIYDVEEGVSDNSLSSLVKRLREKLGDEPKNPRYIDTLHGVGFRLFNWKMKEKTDRILPKS
jgi:hypothetical protein